MAWFVTIVVLVIAAILIVLFLSRYYRKATREVSVVRTGMGGQKVVLDGGCLALPFLHKVSEVNMRTSKLDIERAGPKSIITKDRLRVDVAAEFYVRVEDTQRGVATAAQALGGKSFRALDLEEILEGKLVNAMLSVAASYTMDDLQDNRAKYAREVSEMLDENLAKNGLMLESMSLTRIDQTPFNALDENNAFNAVGMRRLAQVIAVNKKERAVFECSDGEQALSRYAELLPDWVLMDVDMPGMDGLTATREIIRTHPEARIVILTQHDSPELERAAFAAGALAFLSKTNLDHLPKLLTTLIK